MASTSYAITVASGKVYRFDRNTISSIKALGRVLREQADQHSLPWQNIEKHG
jgi:hypothetical protein